MIRSSPAVAMLARLKWLMKQSPIRKARIPQREREAAGALARDAPSPLGSGSRLFGCTVIPDYNTGKIQKQPSFQAVGETDLGGVTYSDSATKCLATKSSFKVTPSPGLSGTWMKPSLPACTFSS